MRARRRRARSEGLSLLSSLTYHATAMTYAETKATEMSVRRIRQAPVMLTETLASLLT